MERKRARCLSLFLLIPFCLSVLTGCMTTSVNEAERQEEIRQTRITFFRNSLWMVNGSLMDNEDISLLTDGDSNQLDLMKTQIPGLQDIETLSQLTYTGFRQAVIEADTQLQATASLIDFPSLSPQLSGSYVPKQTGIELLVKQHKDKVDTLLDAILDEKLKPAYTLFQEMTKQYDIYSDSIGQLGRQTLAPLKKTFRTTTKTLFESIYYSKAKANEQELLQQSGGKLPIE
ncbi:MAG: hypothetical protein LKE40_05245 [Spirochaetia bacterium]|nr:hypothetical protein [Spirochaetia bacterium]